MQRKRHRCRHRLSSDLRGRKTQLARGADGCFTQAVAWIRDDLGAGYDPGCVQPKTKQDRSFALLAARFRRVEAAQVRLRGEVRQLRQRGGQRVFLGGVWLDFFRSRRALRGWGVQRVAGGYREVAALCGTVGRDSARYLRLGRREKRSEER